MGGSNKAEDSERAKEGVSEVGGGTTEEASSVAAGGVELGPGSTTIPGAGTRRIDSRDRGERDKWRPGSTANQNWNNNMRGGERGERIKAGRERKGKGKVEERDAGHETWHKFEVWLTCN